jgi:hypothetical protein
VGTCCGVQLVGLCQSVDTVPVQVIESAWIQARGRAHTSSSESILKMPTPGEQAAAHLGIAIAE